MSWYGSVADHGRAHSPLHCNIVAVRGQWRKPAPSKPGQRGMVCGVTRGSNGRELHATLSLVTHNNHGFRPDQLEVKKIMVSRRGILEIVVVTTQVL